MSTHIIAHSVTRTSRRALCRVVLTTLAYLVDGAGALLGGLVVALHESRRREAQRTIRQHGHLIDKSQGVADINDISPCAGIHASAPSKSPFLPATDGRGLDFAGRRREQHRIC